MLHQVRIARKGMATVRSGCAWFRLTLCLQPKIMHHARHTLVVDCPALASQLVRHAPLAIPGPRGCHLCASPLQASIWRGRRPMRVTTAGAVYDLAHHAHWVLLCQHRDHRPFLLKGELNTPETFFALSNSMASRPTSRSHSAIRSCSALRFWSCSKTSGARSSNSVFQRASTCGLS